MVLTPLQHVVAGIYTESSDLRTSTGAAQAQYGGAGDLYFVDLGGEGTALVSATYLGGSGQESFNRLISDSAGNIIAVGGTASPHFPTTTGSPARSGPTDGLVLKLNSGLTPVFARLIGGKGGDFAIGAATDASNAIYVVGDTNSSDFPATAGVRQTAFGGGTDSFFSGQNFALPKDQQSLNKWFDTAQFQRFPDKSANITTYPAWTGVMSLPGANYKPAASDATKNGVYQDFATYIRDYPTCWGSVRASRTNALDMGIYKNFLIRERLKTQFRFETYNTFNHPRFAAPNSDPTSSSFGVVGASQQNAPRTVQMALKISF